MLCVCAAALLGIAGWTRVRSPYETQQGWVQHQPVPFSQGQTAIEPSSSISIDEQKKPMVNFKGGASLADIVKAVNAIGASPADMVAILEALKQAGAMKADLVVL